MNSQKIKDKLTRLIPHFGELDESLQQNFIDSLKGNKPLFSWLNDEPPIRPFLADNFAMRRVFANQPSAQKDYPLILKEHPAYHQLEKTIYRQKFSEITLPVEILDDENLDYLMLRDYSKLPFPKNWLQQFLADSQPESLDIQAKIKDFFKNDFGFLFKTSDLNFYFLIQKSLIKLSVQDKNQALIELLNQDWNNFPGLLDNLKPLTDFAFSWLDHYLEKLKKYMDEISQAHVFYRFFGISSDHVILGTSLETPTIPFINILDFYNYHTHRKSIHSAMNVWQALFKPLRPFFNEYVDLAQTEKNIIIICFRAFMPVLILSMVLALGYSAILPLAYHQLIEYVFFIPTLYFSFVVAGQYIQLKNYLYLNFIQWYFGSIYAAPAFQANSVLLEVFQSEELTQKIANFYVFMFEQCDKIENIFSTMKGNLTTQQMTNRRLNIQLKSELISEWQDIRLGYLGTEQIPKIVKNRLQIDKESTQKSLKQFYELYFNLIDSQKKPFKQEYDVLKTRYETITGLEKELESMDFSPQIEALNQSSLEQVLRIL
ncbi:MAG TPA: hypothetical protein DCZ80_04410 [Legionellales bacterium]|nr:hypothetical protein [Legionellales bacterium]